MAGLGYIELFRCTPNLLWILFIYFTVKGSDVFISVLRLRSSPPPLWPRSCAAASTPSPRASLRRPRAGLWLLCEHALTSSCRQTFKTIIPALFSQCTTVIKDSSYLAGINVMEFMFSAKVVMGYTTDLSQVLLLYGFVFLLYFALNFGISPWCARISDAWSRRREVVMAIDIMDASAGAPDAGAIASRCGFRPPRPTARAAGGHHHRA